MLFFSLPTVLYFFCSLILVCSFDLMNLLISSNHHKVTVFYHTMSLKYHFLFPSYSNDMVRTQPGIKKYQFNFRAKLLVKTLLLSALKWNGNDETETQLDIDVQEEQIFLDVFGLNRNIRKYGKQKLAFLFSVLTSWWLYHSHFS